MEIRYYVKNGVAATRMYDGSLGYYFPYDENVEERITCANKIMYLENRLIEDEQKYLDYNVMRGICLKNYKTMSALAAVGAVSTSVGLGILSKMVGVESFSTVFGEIGVMEAEFKITLPIMLAVGQGCCLPYLTSYPSTSEVSAFFEVVRYEKEQLEKLSSYYKNIRKDEKDPEFANFNDNTEHVIDDEAILTYLKDSINLRYFYGSDKDKVLEMYRDGSLFGLLYGHKIYSDEAIIDFIEFLESEIEKSKNEDCGYNKMMKKSI